MFYGKLNILYQFKFRFFFIYSEMVYYEYISYTKILFYEKSHFLIMKTTLFQVFISQIFFLIN